MNQFTRKQNRSPGERAFDLCFLPFAAFCVLAFCTVSIIRWLRGPYEARLAVVKSPPSAWLIWIPFGLGVLLGVLWVRALISVIRAWSDPSFRIPLVTELGSVTHPSPKLCFESVVGAVRLRVRDRSPLDRRGLVRQSTVAEHSSEDGCVTQCNCVTRRLAGRAFLPRSQSPDWERTCLRISDSGAVGTRRGDR